MSNKPDNDQNKNVAKKSKSHLVTNIQFAGKVVRIFWEDAFGDIKESFARLTPVKASGGSIGCSLIHTSPIHKSKNDHNGAYFVLSKDEDAKRNTFPDFPVRCVLEYKDSTDKSDTLPKPKIVIDDCYPSIDVAAMAAANKIITEMKILNCEYSISIYQCPECKQYFLGGIRKGFKKSVTFDGSLPFQYIIGAVECNFALVAVVHSHPIIREKDWCPDVGEHIGKSRGKPCQYAKIDVESNRYCCTSNEDYTGGNHDFSTEDYSNLYDLKTSTIGYLVAKKTSVKESDGWTLVKFEWPTGNNFNNGVRVWEPEKNDGFWDNVKRASDSELLHDVFYMSQRYYNNLNNYNQLKKFPLVYTYACACRTWIKVASDIIIDGKLLKEMPIILNYDNLPNDSWKAKIKSYLASEEWKSVSESLQCERISENAKKTILRLNSKSGWRCPENCTLTPRCGW